MLIDVARVSNSCISYDFRISINLSYYCEALIMTVVNEINHYIFYYPKYLIHNWFTANIFTFLFSMHMFLQSNN